MNTHRGDLIFVVCLVLLGSFGVAMVHRDNEKHRDAETRRAKAADVLLRERTAERDQALAQLTRVQETNALLHESLIQATDKVAGLLEEAIKDQDEIDRQAFLIEGLRNVQGDYR